MEQQDVLSRENADVEPRTEAMTIPGLVDLQVNGYKGVDFSGGDLTQDDFAGSFRELLAAGTTAFLPTLITSPIDLYERNLPLLAKVLGRREFRKHVPGVHLEGPFISPQEGARGAHLEQWVRRPDIALLDKLIEWSQGTIRLLTIAADQEGAAELSRHATDRGITVSLGHHMARDEDLVRLVAHGAKGLTHLGNGIPSALDRHGNPVWAGLANDGLAATIIADGHHLPPALLKTIVRAKGVERCIVISDASPLAGMPPGRYDSMGARVHLREDGKLYNPATGYMAGSSATILDCANHLASLGIVLPTDLVRMCFYNPLRLIGVSPNQIETDTKMRFGVEGRRIFRQ